MITIKKLKTLQFFLFQKKKKKVSRAFNSKVAPILSASHFHLARTDTSASIFHSFGEGAKGKFDRKNFRNSSP